MKQEKVLIWTDGSCLANPGGPGGWAFLIRHMGVEMAESGFEPSTTNNRMEIVAAIKAMEYLERVAPHSVAWVYTDSALLVNTMTAGWRRKSNADLWSRLDRQVKRTTVIWTWVRGHSGVAENERVDKMARLAAYGFAQMEAS